jgi:hypothetical protein
MVDKCRKPVPMQESSHNGAVDKSGMIMGLGRIPAIHTPNNLHTLPRILNLCEG